MAKLKCQIGTRDISLAVVRLRISNQEEQNASTRVTPCWQIMEPQGQKDLTLLIRRIHVSMDT